MTPREFCFWLHGYMELTHEFKGLSAEQVKTIEDHLDLVFTKITPDNDILFPPQPNQPIQPLMPWDWPHQPHFPNPPWYPDTFFGDQKIYC